MSYPIYEKLDSTVNARIPMRVKEQLEVESKEIQKMLQKEFGESTRFTTSNYIHSIFEHVFSQEDHVQKIVLDIKNKM